MSPTIVIRAVVILWAFIAAIVIGYPLAAGKIRVGGPGSDPVTRQGDPRGFWFSYAISTGLFLAVSAAAAWFVGTLLP